MSIYLLEMILKFLRMIFVAFISIFNIGLYTEAEENIQNVIINKNTYAVNILKVDNELSKPNKAINQIKSSNNVASKKITGTKNNKNKSTTSKEELIINNQQNPNLLKSNQHLNKSLDEYVGRLTGYGPDCVGCSGKGNLACKTRENKKFSLVKDGIYYDDKEYGRVRILSAAVSKFKCGTIISVKKEGSEPFIGIVLDTGADMKKAWENGNVWMDLAYSSNAMAGSDNLTGKNIKFSIQRWGW